MSLFFIGGITILGIIGGKLIFKSWFNHLTIYSMSMGGLTFFYELKLLPYPDLIVLAWFFILGSSASFVLGIFTVTSARSLRGDLTDTHQPLISLPIFADGGKTLKYSVLFFSIIGLLVAIHRWYVLLKMFGSVPSIFLHAARIYNLNAKGEIKEFIPYVPSFIYVGVFLAGIYTAYKGKFSFLSFFPLFCVVLKELTYFGRGEMLFSAMEFFFTFFLVRNLLKRDALQRYTFSRSNALVAATFILLFLVIAASVIRISRGAKENYRGTSRFLTEAQGSMIISPSVYLYVSSDVGVLSKYLDLEKEHVRFGENSFRIVYESLSRLRAVEEPTFYQKMYAIPMWTNTGTYIRELHADFGVAGVFLFPYLLGLATTFFWFKFYENHNLIVLTMLVYLFIIVGFTFLMMITRLNIWFFGQILIIAYLPIMKRIAIRVHH